LADDRLYWLRHENQDLILDAYFELHPQKRGSQTVHGFFDEVQALPHWPLFIDRLMRTEKCEVTVASSLLPSPDEDTSSPLTGRIVSWEIFLLSFREFLDSKGIESDGPLSTKQRLTIQKAFEDAGLLFSVNIFSSSPTRISVNPRKVYCVDHALAASVSSGILSNRDSLLENLVFTALRRVTPEIFYHKTNNGSGGGPCRVAAISAGTRTSHSADPGLRLAGRSPRQAERSPFPLRSHGRAGGGGGDHRHLAHR
jgi:predicted AAA+ superfamily ATPase